MKENRELNKGSITVEACIALTLFMFLVLTLYSFFYVFEAQMKIQLNLIRTAESMSIDPFVATRVDSKILGHDTSVSDILASISVNIAQKNDVFFEEGDWTQVPQALTSTAMTRFVAYYNGGDESAMKDSLKKLRVVDGKIDLSQSTIENGNLKLVATYELKYLFDYPAFHMPDLKMKQTAVSKIWK